MKSFIVLPLVALASLGLAWNPVAWGAEDPKPAPTERKKDETPMPSVDKGDKAEVGKLAPEFKLKDLDGKETKLSDHKGKIVVLEWFNPGCPFVVAAYDEKGPMKDMRARYQGEGIVWLAINSGAAGMEGADAKANKEFAEKHKLRAPILLDPEGVVGKAYGAKTTPHMYVINEKGMLVYRGAVDNAPNNKVEGEGPKANYVDAAIKDLKSGHAVATAETRSYGCSVKYAKK